nr:DegV family protein [uncultured Anaerostipes sp.]
MGRIAIVTDSNSGITQQEGKELGISVLPMPFYINETLYFEEITLSQEEFYQKLEEEQDIKTSQPAPGDVTDLWDQLLKEYDEIVHIAMSSGLSSSCATAEMLAEDYHGKVQVVNNQRISVTQKRSVLDALELREEGKTAAQIKEVLEKEKFESGIYIMVDTLKYLKKGGRVTPAAAAVGTVLGIKPVLQIHGEKLDAYAKTRGVKTAKKKMIAAVRKELEERFPDGDYGKHAYLDAAYTGNREEAEKWAAELQEAFPGMEFDMDPLSLSVACHIGYGALAVAWAHKYSDC